MDMIEEVKKILFENGVWNRGQIARQIDQLYEAQAKKLLLSISKESKRLDQTTYLVPDYTKFREAIKKVGIRE